MNHPHIAQSTTPLPGASGGVAIDVIVPLSDGLPTTRRSLDSIVQHHIGSGRLILVGDGLDAKDMQWLKNISQAHRFVTLIENRVRLGRTRAVNRALREASGNDVVLLSGRVTVTPGWLLGLLRCAESSSAIGLVGPLSNTAELGAGQALLLPSGDDARRASAVDVALVVAEFSRREYPRVSCLDSACVFVKRGVLEELGLFDDATFPCGHGEVFDYCLRASGAGFELAVADDVYVQVGAQDGVTAGQEVLLSKAAHSALRRKHGARAVDEALSTKSKALGSLQDAVAAAFEPSHKRGLVLRKSFVRLDELATHGIALFRQAVHREGLDRSLETARRKVRKLKRDPQRFFADSQSPAVRIIGKLMTGKR